jgi:molybdopterin biosynthesis enzyme
MVSHQAARAKVIEVVHARSSAHALATETIEFVKDPSRALGRILAENVLADRNYPPFDRSTRDGFALRAVDAVNPGARLRLIGESRAGRAFAGQMETGTCVQIMTGAPLPRGTNAVVMLEDARIEGDSVVIERGVRVGQHYVLEGQETRAGETVVKRG